MARSPLLDMVCRAARPRPDTATAHSRSVRRRDFLRGSMAVAAASVVPVAGLAATARIAIVGAGLAGLTAARELRKANLDADLFEASTRIGGRCYSARGIFGAGQVAEHGGEFIDSVHVEIQALARELGLTLDDVLKATRKGATERYVFDGRPYSLADATRDWQPLRPILRQQVEAIGDYDYRRSTPEARRFDAMTIGEWVAAYVPGGRQGQLGQLLDAAFTEENGADCDRQSALNLISVLGESRRARFNLYYDESDQRFHVRGGNDQIVHLLAKGLGEKIATATPLVAVARLDDGRIRLSLKRDAGIADVTYDRVILALPFSVMKATVDFSRAGFQPLKSRAIETLPIGASTKFQMQFVRRPWVDAGCNGEMRMPSRTFQTTWEVSRAQPGQPGILNFFSGGTRALAAGKTDSVALAGMVMQDLAPVLPNLGELWTGLMIKDAWKDNPWSLGSYSYYGPGYQTALGGVEAEPEGNCFFAGEHTAKEPAFLNSAVESGTRAAREVIASLR